MNKDIDPRYAKYINKLYSNTTGFKLADNDKLHSANNTEDVFSTYGEITPSAVSEMIASINVNNDDVFYDLGSGTGKVPVQFYLETPVKKAVGVELGTHRYTVSMNVKNFIDTNFYSKYKTLEFINENMKEVDLSDATIVYMCSTCFSDKLLMDMYDKLKYNTNLKYIISLKEIPGLKSTFKKKLPMTWNPQGSDTHFYEFA